MYEQYRAKIAELGPLWSRSHELVAESLRAATLDELHRARAALGELDAVIDSEMKRLAVLTQQLIELFEAEEEDQSQG